MIIATIKMRGKVHEINHDTLISSCDGSVYIIEDLVKGKVIKITKKALIELQLWKYKWTFREVETGRIPDYCSLFTIEDKK